MFNSLKNKLFQRELSGVYMKVARILADSTSEDETIKKLEDLLNIAKRQKAYLKKFMNKY